MPKRDTDTGDYERFRQTFFEECTELMGTLEGLLEALQDLDGAADQESLNAIFRAVHSIKAGAGAFGYTQLVRFAHNFEAVLDSLRDYRIVFSGSVLQILVRSGDVLATLVDAAQAGRTPAADFGDEVSADLNALLSGKSASPTDAMQKLIKPATDGPAVETTFTIEFFPDAEMFRHANEPLLLLRELRQLGTLTIACDTSRLPPLEKLDPEGAYFGWTMSLATVHPQARISDVFEFVEDACRLVITPVVAAPSTEVHSEFALEPEQTAVTGTSPAHAMSEEPEKTRGRAAASIRVDLARIDRLVNMVGELVITQSMLAQQISDLALGHGKQAVRGQDDLELLTRELQECVMAIRMQAVKSVFSRMPRLVRDVSGKLGKSVRLLMSGEQTEVDKTVIEELADPLTHMIRNAIDHGIESPEARAAAGKPPEGTIELSALHAGSNILIHISDDGGGIDKDRLIAKAIAKGIIPANATLTEDEVHELLFAPGFSTAEKITDVSGRGVGMDVVRRNIVNLGGRIQVQSVLGKGTRFTLIIPLTLAVLDGMIVAIGSERYILPLTSIIESYRPDRQHIRTVTGGVQVAAIRGEYIRLVYLQELFGVAGTITNPAQGLVVLVETAQGAKIGIVVDELIGQQQVVIKSLSENFDPVQGISGATILGNGRVALIVDIEQISRMTTLTQNRLTSPSLALQAFGAAA